MQMIITDARLAKSRSFQLSRTRVTLAFVGFSFVMMLTTAALYHWVFLKGARDGWPVVGSLVKFVVKDEFAQRDRYMRENLVVMAKKLGEMQAKMLQLESLGERVSGLAGITAVGGKTLAGQGGRLVLERELTMDELNASMQGFDQWTNQNAQLTEWQRGKSCCGIGTRSFWFHGGWGNNGRSFYRYLNNGRVHSWLLNDSLPI